LFLFLPCSSLPSNRYNLSAQRVMPGIVLGLCVVLLAISVADAADPCSYCGYCTFCGDCKQCPCTDKPNCKYCKYCMYCTPLCEYMCPTVCGETGFLASATQTLSSYLSWLGEQTGISKEPDYDEIQKDIANLAPKLKARATTKSSGTANTAQKDEL